jgi:hypothetical protein
VRKTRALVIPRHDEHGNAEVRDASEGLERLVRDGGHDLGPIEHVPAVDDDIDLAGERGRERRRVVREKVVSSPPSLDARAHRKIEPEMRVGD